MSDSIVVILYCLFLYETELFQNMAEIAEDQQVADQNTEVKRKDEMVTNGEVETLGAQDNKMSESGDAPASKEEAEDTTEVVADATEESEQKDSETTAERTQPDEAEIKEKDNETKATKEEEEEDPDWVDILGTGHLKKKVLREGQGMDTRPERGQLVTIKSSGQVEGGGQVDCNEEIQFVLGDGDVVQGKCFFNMNSVNTKP